MPEIGASEIAFIAFILIFTALATFFSAYFFVRQYRREKRDADKSKKAEASEKDYVSK